MKKKPEEQSPLERLVQAAEQQEARDAAEERKRKSKNLPVKLEPKNRFKKPKVLTPIVEDTLPTQILSEEEVAQLQAAGYELPGGVIIANSSLTLNFNVNVDDKAVDKMVQTSKKVVKGIAAAGAAMLGTAFLMNNKAVDKVKIPLTPNPKVPKEKPKSK